VISSAIDTITNWTGHPTTSVLAVLATLADLALGWRDNWSPTWINGNGAATGLVAILLLFFLQHATNRDNRALQAKLDAQIAVNANVDNRLIASEHLSEPEIKDPQQQTAGHRR
jgi:low affinity Fe/Cu permease